MLEIIDAIRNRRSIRQYNGKPIDETALQTILEAGLLAPSGRNLKPQEFIVVRNRETLDKLSMARDGGAAMLKGADAAIVVVADKNVTDVWTEDCSIAMAYMHLTADALGLGSCWIQGRLRKTADGVSTDSYVRELLGVPENYCLEAILSLGCIDQHPEKNELTEALCSKVHYDMF